METFYLQIALKLISGLIVVLVYIRIAGKGSLAPVSALDQVGNMVLGAIIGGTLYSESIGIFTMVCVSSVWAGLLLFVRYVTFKVSHVKNAVDGRSIPLLRGGILLSDNFGQARISLRDFIMMLHQRGVNNIDELQNIWFDSNGQITMQKKGEEAMSYMVIDNGNFVRDTMEQLGFEEEWLDKEIQKEGYIREDVFLAEWHHNKVWIYPITKNNDVEKK